jgi:hypothetical protein
MDRKLVFSMIVIYLTSLSETKRDKMIKDRVVESLANAIRTLRKEQLALLLYAFLQDSKP